MNGLLIVDKPMGWTSHDVVAHVKRKLGAKKVGHLGTLDPLATGALLLVIDKATRFSTSLDKGAKDYQARIQLGVETETYDSEGKITAEKDPSRVTKEDVLKALEAFKGKISQVPPMYSAIKSGGSPLYKLARKGITVERKGRDIEIYSLELLDFTLPFIEIRCLCSKGTYIRSLAHDLGLSLSTGAHLVGLRRLASGPFTVKGAPSPKEEAQALMDRIIPLEEALQMAGEAGGLEGAVS